MSHRTSSGRATRKLKQGDRLEIGSLQLDVLEVPGHTPDALAFLVSGVVFTGDTLLIGSSGRTDFPGADPSQQYDSIHKTLGSLPESTIVMPGHDYSNLVFSTIGTEKARNEHWLISTRDEFVKMKKAEIHGALSAEISDRIEYNLAAHPDRKPAHQFAGAAAACGSAMNSPVRVAAISVDKYFHKLQEHGKDVAFVDVREPGEYLDGHIDGTINLPLSEVALHLPELLKFKRVYVSCLSGRRSAMIAQTLNYVGMADTVNVSGGFQAWGQAGYPVIKPKQTGT
jgi:sulfur dioxygenase